MTGLEIIRESLSFDILKKLAEGGFGDFVKAVVDTEREIMAIGGELHSDEETLLIEDGSDDINLWGINIYPFAKDESFIEFDSIINIRPAKANYSRDVEDPEVREKIRKVVNKLIKR